MGCFLALAQPQIEIENLELRPQDEFVALADNCDLAMRGKLAKINKAELAEKYKLFIPKERETFRKKLEFIKN